MGLAFGGLPSEIESRLTYADFMMLQAYVLKHGPFNDERRYDRVAAVIAWTVGAANAGRDYKGKMKDFMPWPIEEEKPLSFQEVAASFGGAAKKGR